jgi:hypothetical protein
MLHTMRPTLWMDPPTVCDEFIDVVVKTVLLIHTPFSVLVWIECNSQEEQEVNLETQRVAACPDGLKHSV